MKIFKTNQLLLSSLGITTITGLVSILIGMVIWEVESIVVVGAISAVVLSLWSFCLYLIFFSYHKIVLDEKGNAIFYSYAKKRQINLTEIKSIKIGFANVHGAGRSSYGFPVIFYLNNNKKIKFQAVGDLNNFYLFLRNDPKYKLLFTNSK